MSNLEDHEAEQTKHTALWESMADAYIAAPYGERPHHDNDCEMDFHVDDDGAFVTIRVYITREEAGI